MRRSLHPVRRNLLSRAALAAAALALGACSSGSSAPSGPAIAAALVSFPIFGAPDGFDTGASVAVLNPADGYPIATATVTMNGVALPYDPTRGEYVGSVMVAPGASVTVSVTVDGRVYQASTTQFATYPQVQTPAPGDDWFGYSAHGVSWSAGTPTADSMYALLVLDAADPNGFLVWPPDQSPRMLPLGTTSYSIPADGLSVGDRLVLVGLAREVAIPGALAGSGLIVGGFTFAPVHVMDDSGRTWRSASAIGIPQFATLLGVAWTGSQLVAVGYGTDLGGCPQYGLIVTSPDAQTWTRRTDCQSAPMIPLWGIAASGTQIVVVGASGILTSPDGATWTAQSGAEGKFLLDVAWSGTTFVAVGEGGVILTSTDGTSWAPQTSGTQDDLWAVAWNGAAFVAAGGNGTILLSSADGTSWSPATSGTTNGLLGVGGPAGMMVAVGGAGTILTSAGGLSWTSVGPGTTLPNYQGVGWSGQRLVAVGSQGTIATSTDGATWTSRFSPLSVDLRGVAWTGTRWVAVGDSTVLLSP